MAVLAFEETQFGPHKRHWLADLFSFPVMCMFLLAGVILRYAIQGIAEPDIWWHMRDASYLFQHHTLPRVDTYTFAGAGSPWMNFQWLSEIPFLLAFRVLGLQGVLLVYTTVLILIFAGVYYRSCTAGADCKDAAIATLAAICLGGVSMAPRTLLFGWLCLAGLLLVLDRFSHTGRGLWVLPLLFALWINLHGSWVFGMVVLAIITICGLSKGEWGPVVARHWTARERKALLIASVASIGALFVNPYGYHLVLYPRFLLFHQHTVMQTIEEWRPVTLGTWNGSLALIFIGLLFAAVLLSRVPWRLDEVMLMAFALWAALSHGRFWFFAGMVITPILAPRMKLFPPYDRSVDKPWLNASIMAAVIGAMVFFFPSATNLQHRVEERFPLAAVDFMRKQHITGRIFNLYGWGGYIEWNAPELKLFVDGRADVFVYNGIFDETVKAMSGDDSFEILDKYRIDYVLFQPNQPLTYLLGHSPGWRVIYKDDVAVLIERSSIGGPAAK